MKFLFLAFFLIVQPASAGPVLVELFTSQGCSSCPDADRLLSTWGHSEFRAGHVLPLSFSVDYWNALGWADVFSAPSWSRRQASYASAIRARSYTPQMVVAGRESFVGSDGDRAAAAVSRYSNETPRALLSLQKHPGSASSLDISVAVLPQAGGLHAMLAFFENGLHTNVTRGENGGRELRNDFVVRRLIDLGPVDSRQTMKRTLDANLEQGWNAQNMGAALFVQDLDGLAVYDAQALFPLVK